MIEEMGTTSGFADWTWRRYDHKWLLLEAMEECERQGKRYVLTFERIVKTRHVTDPRDRGIWPFRWTTYEWKAVGYLAPVWGLTVEKDGNGGAAA